MSSMGVKKPDIIGFFYKKKKDSANNKNKKW